MADPPSQEQTDLLREILDKVPLMIALADRHGRNVWVNRYWTETLGLSAKDGQHQDVFSRLYPDPADRARVAAFIERAEGAWEDFHMAIGEGREIDASWCAMPFSDDLVLGIGRDVTEQRRLAAERESMNAALGRSRRLESLGRLAGGVAHDINNLLTPVLGHAEVMLREIAADHPHREGLQEVCAAALRARRLVEQLLAFGRRRPMSIETLDIHFVIEEFAAMLDRLLGDDVELRVHRDASRSHVAQDRAQIEQVLLNLAINAREAMPRGGRLTIRTADAAGEPGRLCLSVSDTGLGMDRATIDRIFEPFFSTKSLDRGAGLGLSTVYGIVEQHGGTIRVESTPGEGSTFVVTLPLAEPPVALAAAPAVAEPEAQRTKPLRVLLVEDDDAVRRVVGRFLRSLGHDVVAVSGPEEAIQHVEGEGNEPDVLLTDVVMPKMRGPEVHARIVARSPLVRAIFMSGYAADAVVDAAGLPRGVVFLQKPFSLAALRKALDQALRGSENAR